VPETFALQLKAFAEKAQGNARTVVRKVSQDTLASVVMKTPVGNPSLWKHPAPKGYVGGRLRANWNVSLSVPDESTSEARDKAGASTVARGAAKIDGYTGEDIYVVNSLPYAIPIEYGHSIKQAPAGMVRVTVTEFQNFVDRAAASVK
jgi:hypothetical protein